MNITEQLRLRHRAWKYRLRQDKAEVHLLLRCLRPGDVAVDIGAHKGAYTYWLRSAVGPAGAVYAFEPQPGLADRLERLAARWDNVHLQQAAVSEQAGQMTLVIPGGGDSPGAHLVGDGNTGDGPGPSEQPGDTRVQVEVVALDDVLAGESRPVRFIKCDVEGYELDVFRGAQRVLREHRPTILFECERRHQRDGRSMDDTFAYLQSLGMTGSFFAGESLRPIAEFDPTQHQPMTGERFWDAPGYCNNFVFEAGQ